MPTYEYECQRCGHVFDKFQGINEAPAKRCPKCKGKVQRRIGTGGGILFKGSGFYSTDYRSDSYRSGAKAEKTVPAKAAESSSTSKPAKSDSCAKAVS